MEEAQLQGELQGEIEEMFGNLVDEGSVESESESEPEVEDSESSIENEQTPIEDEPSSDGGRGESPEGDSEEFSPPEESIEEPLMEASSDEEEPSGEVDEVEELRARNQALMERIEELSGRVMQTNAPRMLDRDARTPSTEESPPQAQPQTQPADGQPPNFLDGVTIDDLLESPEKLNGVLLAVANHARESATHVAAERVLRSVPELVMGYISRHTVMTNLVNDFYRENQDLANVKQTVAAVANDVHAKNPDWGPEKVFKETAKATRKLLGLKEKAQNSMETEPKPKKKPAFAKQRGTRGGEPQLSGLQKEVNELLIDF